jgi:hypothetical protein
MTGPEIRRNLVFLEDFWNLWKVGETLETQFLELHNFMGT